MSMEAKYLKLIINKLFIVGILIFSSTLLFSQDKKWYNNIDINIGLTSSLPIGYSDFSLYKHPRRTPFDEENYKQLSYSFDQTLGYRLGLNYDFKLTEKFGLTIGARVQTRNAKFSRIEKNELSAYYQTVQENNFNTELALFSTYNMRNFTFSLGTGIVLNANQNKKFTLSVETDNNIPQEVIMSLHNHPYFNNRIENYLFVPSFKVDYKIKKDILNNIGLFLNIEHRSFHFDKSSHFDFTIGFSYTI